jgi:hypothetical protein
VDTPCPVPVRKTYVVFASHHGHAFHQIAARDHALVPAPPPCSVLYCFCDRLEITVPDPESGKLVTLVSDLMNHSPQFVLRGRLVRRKGIAGLAGIMIIISPNGIEPSHDIIAEATGGCEQVSLPCFPDELGSKYVIREQTGPNDP